MEPIVLKQRALEWLRRNRYVALVLAAGILLMLLPTGSQEKAAAPAETPPTLQEELEAILGCLEGAGKVRVLLTQAQGERTLYQTDTDVDGDTSRQDTVIVTGEDRSQSGLVRQVEPPVYRGAVVLCQGAGKPSVRLAVVEAVAKATGLPSSRISVLKMK